jgi:hypothetical protein
MRSAAVRVTRSCSCLGAMACLLCGLAWPQNGATPLPHPDDETITDGVYVSKYFDLSYPLLPGWTKGMAGPGPSHLGYYVLSTLMPANQQRAIMLITAQDMFFAPAAFRGATAMTHEIGRAVSKIEGMTLDRPPSEEMIAGRPFSRIDFSGVGLFRSTLTTQIRCHLVSFNITASSPDLLAELVLSLDKLGRTDEGSGRAADPICKPHEGLTKHLLTRVDPPAIAPFTPIPVRIIIDAGGSVKHVHVIRATPDQRTGIEAALGKWRFGQLEDGTVELETGLLIEFTPAGAVKYLSGDQAPPF